MTKRMLIDALHPEETRVVIADENQIYDFDFVSTSKKQLKGNIYLAKITRVEPSLQAAFVEYGGGKQGFLPFAEIHTDYYQIPVSDRKRLMEEMAKEINYDESETVSASDSTENVGSEDTAKDSDIADFASEENASGEQGETEKQLEEVTEENNTEQNRPAYLMQGAIELTISEDANAPFALDGEATNEESIISSEELITSEVKDSETPDLFGEQPIENAENGEAQTLSENSDAEKEEVETLSNEEEELANKRKRNNFMRRYKIQEVIRRGQVVLIQVIKEERGNKGVSLTTYLSLAGRYCVLMPNSPKDGGISRKIASAEDRKRLKAISTEFKLAEGMSVIIRTAGMDRTHAEIKRDFDYLVKLWNAIREDTLSSNAPALIYEESDIVKRAIRDQYSNDIDEIMIEGETAFKSAREFMKLLLPSHLPKVKQYSAQTPLFYAYAIEDQLLSMHDPVVKMKSGAYLVINPTEAMISIDVNSGRATGERNIEETALKTNLEAAAEIAKQLRLRDLAGLVVIDFIDMVDSRNRRAVEKMLKDSMKTDRAKIQLGRISPFGLLEMSRQRLRSSISETNMTPCPHCIGRGVIRSNESMSIQVVRSIERDASNGNISGLRVLCPQSLAMYMLNFKRDALRELEKRHGISIQILINPELALSDFTIEKVKRNNNDRIENNDSRRGKWPEKTDRQRGVEVLPKVSEGNSEVDDKEVTASNSGQSNDNPRRNRRRGKRGGKGNFNNRPDNNTENNTENNAENAQHNPSDNVISLDPNLTSDNAEINLQEANDYSQKRPPRDRGNRGRREWRDKNSKPDNNQQNLNNDVPTSWNGGAAELADGKVLPAFASDLRPVALPAPPTYKPFHDYKEPEQAAANKPQEQAPASPPKRGWWQKMISLDD